MASPTWEAPRVNDRCTTMGNSCWNGPPKTIPTASNCIRTTTRRSARTSSKPWPIPRPPSSPCQRFLRTGAGEEDAGNRGRFRRTGTSLRTSSRKTGMQRESRGAIDRFIPRPSQNLRHRQLKAIHLIVIGARPRQAPHPARSGATGNHGRALRGTRPSQGRAQPEGSPD